MGERIGTLVGRKGKDPSVAKKVGGPTSLPAKKSYEESSFCGHS